MTYVLRRGGALRALAIQVLMEKPNSKYYKWWCQEQACPQTHTGQFQTIRHKEPINGPDLLVVSADSHVASPTSECCSHLGHLATVPWQRQSNTNGMDRCDANAVAKQNCNNTALDVLADNSTTEQGYRSRTIIVIGN